MKKVSILALHLGYGGIEKCIVSLANLLASSYEVEIISIYKLYEKPVFSLSPAVKIRYLLEDRKPNREAFREAFSKKKIVTALKEGMKGVKTLYLRRKVMVEAIETSDADILIATRDILDEWLSLYGKESALKIGWEHNHHHNNEKYARDIVRSCKGLDILVLVSKDLEKFYKKQMRPYPCKCIYIPNMLETFPRTSASLLEKHLISVGRLSPEKGYFDLLSLAPYLAKKHPDWHLDIVGDGKERKKLDEKIKKEHLESFVTLHGFQNSKEIAKLLEASSIYLMTSYTESFGIVLIEAMSHGLPCIAYDSAEGAREIIQSGYNGYLIKNRNSTAYLKKVEDLMKKKEVREELGKNAKESVRKYSRKHVEKMWLSLLQRSSK